MIDERPVLVIGYGNTLRTDDSIGPRAASVVQGWGLANVLACGVTQLTPELAEPLSAARLAVFVDARQAPNGGASGVEVRPIEISEVTSTFGHTSDPGYLLSLAQAVYGSHPRAWLVTVPAHDLALGDGLSPPARQGLEVALGRIAELLKEPGPG
ncbi:hydrogenase maturation protease [Tundrisphaera lichenicola]|uniref:hydrogenase maturation protease n=1 Tax=Tundrisphaera lichenicola TaxID=2029860 RepID=UPI003EB9A4EA